MSKHTPGPWKVGLPSIPDVFADDNRLIAECYSPRISMKERQANARLIAAAPDLLESLCFERSVIRGGRRMV